MSGLSSLKKNF